MRRLPQFPPLSAVALLVLICAGAACAQTPSVATGAAPEAPSRTVAEDAALLEKGRIHAQQRALARLGAQTDPEADTVLRAQFARFRARQLAPALWLDLLEAAAKRDDAELKAALAERTRELEKSTDPLVRFRECLEGGDADAGRLIFTKKPEAGCIRCHSVEGKGGKIGPDLTWLRHSIQRINILEALILPSATSALGFQHALLKLKSGEEVSGVVTLETADELTLTSVADGKKRQIKTVDIVNRTPLPSPMPPHFGAVLSKREIRDLVEFIAEGD